MPVQPYLFFNGRCEEAIGFYREALGAETLMLMRFSESPEPVPPGSDGQKIMHSALRIGDATVLASDGMGDAGPEFRGFSLALTVGSEEEARQRFSALAEGGEVRMPLGKTFFSPAFGVVADRFGVSWMVMVES